MPPLQGDPIRARSVYITLNARPVAGSFHRGLLVMDSETKGTFHHVTNRSGGWTYETRNANPHNTMSLVTLILVIEVAGSNNQARSTIGAVPADGQPSPRTGEAFSSRIWLKDVLVALHDTDIIQLPDTVDALEASAQNAGVECLQDAEAGLGATVVNDCTAYGGAKPAN